MSDSGTVSALLQGLSLLLIVSLPVILVAVYAYQPWRGGVTVLAPWAALPALLFAVFAPTGITTELSWLMLGSHLGLDATARVFLFLTALLWLLAGFYARTYLARDDGRDRFFVFYLIAMSGNLCLVLAQDMLSFFLGFATMSFASYGLIVHNPDPETRFAARLYMVLVVLGEVLLFAAMVWAAGIANSLLFEDVTRAMVQAPGREMMLALFLTGFGLKVGVLPMHVWLPFAYPAAPTPASAVLSGAMIKAGLLGWMRFLPLGEMALPFWGIACIALGLSAAFYGILIGITQRGPKTVLAYSSISQMGLMTVAMGCGLAAPDAWSVASVTVGMYALHHALAKGALFLGVGVAAAQIDTAWKRGLVGCGMLLPALSLAGAPFTSGAAAKVSLKTTTAMAPAGWPELLATALPLSAVGTTLLMGRFLILAWPRSMSQTSHLALGLWLPWTLLLIYTALSVFAWPWPSHMAPVSDVFSNKSIWKALWPVGIGTLVTFGIWGWSRRFSLSKSWQIPAGDVFVPIYRLFQISKRRLAVAMVKAPKSSAHLITRQLMSLIMMKPWRTILLRYEQSLESWRVAGTLFVLLVATFLVCLIARFA